MARHRKALDRKDMDVNMTPMIDVVFQMIIFFITAVDMDRKSFDVNIKLAMAPNGAVVEKRDPRTVTIEVDKDGKIQMGKGIRVQQSQLLAILKKAVVDYGQTVPVVIRGDGGTQHEEVRKVMDLCSQAGLWKIKFAATKEAAPPEPS